LRKQDIGYVAIKDVTGESMVNTKAIACLVALSAMLAACSGGSEGEADASVQAEASAPAAPAGPLAATDMSTVDGTSVANFTGNAQRTNLEAGVLVKDRLMVRRLRTYFVSAIESRLLEKVTT
jgi:hypothetical protein